MFRIAALSFAMVLAIGQPAALLCRAGCQPTQTAASDCHHQDLARSQKVMESHGCIDMVLVSAVVREDLRRSAPISVAHSALVAVKYQLASKTAGTPVNDDVAQQRTARYRPLATSLRL